jgi:hypothetical protein
MIDIIGILLIAAFAWYWLDSLTVREIALAAAREACAVEGTQFLDDNVAVRDRRLMRDDEGRLRIGRTYMFEHSEFADERTQGRIVMLGRQIVLVNTGKTRPPNTHDAIAQSNNIYRIH